MDNAAHSGADSRDNGKRVFLPALGHPSAELVTQGQEYQGDGEDAGPDIQAHPKIGGHDPGGQYFQRQGDRTGNEDHGFILPEPGRRERFPE